MDAKAIQSAFEAGPIGVAVLLTLALMFCVRHIISLYKEKDAIRLTQISDTKLALDAVSKSTENINSAEERMALNNEAVKELLAVTRAMMNKGQL